MAKSNMQLHVGTTAINKAIASIANRGGKLDADIQLCALSVMAHADEHGDTSLQDKLVMSMPKGTRAAALVEFLLAFGVARKLDPKNKDEANAIKAGRLFQLDRTRTLNLAGAAEKPWHEFRKAKDSIHTAFDVQKAASSLLKRIKDAAATGDLAHKDEAIIELEAALALLKAPAEPAEDALI